MKKYLLFILCSLIFSMQYCFADALTGGVSTVGLGNKVVDSKTNKPIQGAKITIPLLKFSTLTDENGNFNLGAKINGDTVLSVEKEGYRPFSLTINNQIASQPMVVGIQKSSAHDLIIESAMIHLGDDSFSKDSANSGEFRLKSEGPFYTKLFRLANSALTRSNYLVIGSIIGIDTAMAKSLHQNNIKNSYSSPPEVYFNGTKIAEIHLNGDNQKIKLPNHLIRTDKQNEITIRTGKNMTQFAYIDYDDIEIMNISIQTE